MAIGREKPGGTTLGSLVITPLTGSAERTEGHVFLSQWKNKESEEKREKAK